MVRLFIFTSIFALSLLLAGNSSQAKSAGEFEVIRIVGTWEPEGTDFMTITDKDGQSYTFHQKGPIAYKILEACSYEDTCNVIALVEYGKSGNDIIEVFRANKEF